MPSFIIPIAVAVLGAAATAPEKAVPDPASCWVNHGRCEARGHLRLAEKIEPSPKLAQAVKGKILAAWSMDLDSDGKPDFIVEVEGADIPQTCFVTSGLALRACENGGHNTGDGFGYYWFAQLDDDPMLELFRMSGDEASSDYAIQKLDPKTWKRRDLVQFAPLIRASEKDPHMTSWGYPWDVRDLILDTSKGVRLLVSAPECFSDEDAASQIGVFFSGVPTQGTSDAFLQARKSARWMSLADAVKLAAASKSCRP